MSNISDNKLVCLCNNVSEFAKKSSTSIEKVEEKESATSVFNLNVGGECQCEFGDNDFHPEKIVLDVNRDPSEKEIGIPRYFLEKPMYYRRHRMGLFDPIIW